MNARSEPTGRFVVEDGTEWYRIDEVDALDPFLVNLVTPSDQWMFLSTSGALTAGRRSAEHALFPYETDDRLHRSGGRSGPVTLIRVGEGDAASIWEPFASDVPDGRVRRSLSKSPVGDQLRFEEHSPEHGLTFRYTWAAAPAFGFVRSCELEVDAGRGAVDVELLDGFVDVLPAGVELGAQQTRSTLIDAYRRSEVAEVPGMALFTLEALLSDQPDPAEALLANTIWVAGLDAPTLVLSDREVRGFRSGRPVDSEPLVTGRKGAFLVSTSFGLEPGGHRRWMMVADVAQDHVDVVRLRRRLNNPTALAAEVQASIDAAHGELIDMVAGADALQETADRTVSVHHLANVLFNCMRGGTFIDDHRVEVARVGDFVESRNRSAHVRFTAATLDLEPVVELVALREAVVGDPDLTRLVAEFLPLVFSRRHGDPSRPWNAFRIEPSADGSPTVGYEGNWRDIFQNWEALGHSFPEYIESFIAKFLNASTLDGHNPYRITGEGIDWEVPEEDSWANIGYWGDHQIVYLHRLLDAADRFHPGLLESKLDHQEYCYADAPYRIRPYVDIVADPKVTIDFDHERYRRIGDRVQTLGADGQLVPSVDGLGVHHASLAEKLLVPALAKLSNLVAGAGVWMNLQRPEWNDANNALVGNGVSVVTALYLRAYLQFVDGLLGRSSVEAVPVDDAVVRWLLGLEAAFSAHADMPRSGQVTDVARRDLLDELGRAYSDYRDAVYDDGPGHSTMIHVAALRSFIAVVLPHLDLVASTAARDDGLYEGYVLMRLEAGRARIETLYPMLEGQVAALSSSSFEVGAELDLVDAMFDGPLYRPDQQSFMLYPERRPPAFEEKNVVPDDLVGPTMAALLESDSGIVQRDEDGNVRFSSRLRSDRDLTAVLDDLAETPRFSRLVADGRSEVLEAYEQVFRHRAFTGRSQSFYKYEGLGSVYWHMVSKLLLALQERILDAVDCGEDRMLVSELAVRYCRVRSGLGFMKSVAEQGSFPTDPHSHTPMGYGAQQPGMTGQVKEGVMLRWGELGVRVDGGRIRFRPALLDPAEFLVEGGPWPSLGPGAELDAGTLGFTYCGVPVVYHCTAGERWSKVAWSDGSVTAGGAELDRETSRAVFARTGLIDRIDVGVPIDSLLLAEAHDR